MSYYRCPGCEWRRGYEGRYVCMWAGRCDKATLIALAAPDRKGSVPDAPIKIKTKQELLAESDAHILELRKQGLTYPQISSRIGQSSQYVGGRLTAMRKKGVEI